MSHLLVALYLRAYNFFFRILRILSFFVTSTPVLMVFRAEGLVGTVL